MITFRVGWNAATRVALVRGNATAFPGGTTQIGTFQHPNPYDDSADADADEAHRNHTIFHHVRDMLYHRGEHNMQAVTITIDGVTIPPIAEPDAG